MLGVATIMIGSAEFRRIARNCWDVEERLSDMDADGVDVQVVSPTPVFFSYAAPGDQAGKVCRIFNDIALEICAPEPERFLPFCQVPLQGPDAACEEVDRCLAAGHRGVEIGNHVGDRDLDDEGIVTFLQHCADVGPPVFVHPWDMASSPRLERWMARWLTGMPGETHLSILALVLGGVFDRVPDSLRTCFAHGGGSLPFWLGRMDNAWYQRPDVVGTSQHPPSHSVDRFSVDGVVTATATATGAAVQGHPGEALALAANALAARRLALEPGWIVLTGGMTDAVFAHPGSQISARFTNLGSITLRCR